MYIAHCNIIVNRGKILRYWPFKLPWFLLFLAVSPRFLRINFIAGNSKHNITKISSRSRANTGKIHFYISTYCILLNISWYWMYCITWQCAVSVCQSMLCMMGSVFMCCLVCLVIWCCLLAYVLSYLMVSAGLCA